ncbi:MAG: tRNA pseudouridine(55) synthase TruB [Nitrospirae bacterium RBG_13_39_12]|nr:MAG: tRNA pseudouridine(55) synthase TruB [Nitrospirae bacterium RBG_13_39_12]
MDAENVVINLNKTENISSQRAVTKVKRLFSAGKAGHAGTLDPIATGVLIICLNEATKFTRFLSDLDKEYLVRLKLGEKTDTYDSTGRILKKTDYTFLKEIDIRKTLDQFTGQVKQIPPMYSAVKMNGQPLYKLARKGIEINRPERTVNIYKMEIVYFAMPYVDFRISCSKGTYIRTLCDDVGNALGVGAHMVSLVRTKVGIFRIENSASIEDLKCRKDSIYSIDSAISHLREVILDEDSYYKARNGMPVVSPWLDREGFERSEGWVSCKNVNFNQYVRLKSPDNILFGIGKIKKNKNNYDDIIEIERLLRTL